MDLDVQKLNSVYYDGQFYTYLKNMGQGHQKLQHVEIWSKLRTLNTKICPFGFAFDIYRHEKLTIYQAIHEAQEDVSGYVWGHLMVTS